MTARSRSASRARAPWRPEWVVTSPRPCPEAMEVFDDRQRGVRARPAAALLRHAARGDGRDRAAAAGARRDEPRRAGRAARAGLQAATSWSATRSASSPRSPRRVAMNVARRSRSSASAASRWPRRRESGPGSMAAILGLEDEVGREPLPQDPRRLAGELQLSRPDRRVGRDAGGRRVLRRGRGGGRAPDREAARLRRLPLAARRAGRRPAASGGRAGALQRADGAVHVDGDGAPRVGASEWARCSSTSSPRRSASRRQPRSSSATARAPSSRSVPATCSPGWSSGSTAA